MHVLQTHVLECLCYFKQWIDKIAKYTGIGKQWEKHNKQLQKHNKLIRSSPNPPGLRLLVQLLVVDFFYCVFKQSFYNEELILSPL